MNRLKRAAKVFFGFGAVAVVAQETCLGVTSLAAREEFRAAPGPVKAGLLALALLTLLVYLAAGAIAAVMPLAILLDPIED